MNYVAFEAARAATRALGVCAVGGAVALAGLTVGPGQADAAIKCRGAYQVSGGNLIATPYCEDEYLAQVARTYGSRVSARRLRRSFSAKSELCQFIGRDSRVSDICQKFLPDG
ncbi:MAG: hypothetical protein AAFR70_13280, partial [Pseudomonadota bacterium]